MAKKLIVTHISPDLDAIASVWILKKFDEQHFGSAQVAFVPAGGKLTKQEQDFLGFLGEDVVHVDTGLGEFDHHTEDKGRLPICAASLVRDYVVNLHPDLEEDEALQRMVDHFIEIDHFGEFYWPSPNHPRYNFQLHEILPALKMTGKTDSELVEIGMEMLNAVYAAMGMRVAAEEEMSKGIVFETPWGKGVGFESVNDEVMKYAQKEGFLLVVRKDPEFGNVRIKAAPDKRIDLTEIYEIIIGQDKLATWFLHPSKAMLLNGSRKNQNQVPSSLSLHKIIEIIKSSIKP